MRSSIVPRTDRRPGAPCPSAATAPRTEPTDADGAPDHRRPPLTEQAGPAGATAPAAGQADSGNLTGERLDTGWRATTVPDRLSIEADVLTDGEVQPLDQARTRPAQRVAG